MSVLISFYFLFHQNKNNQISQMKIRVASTLLFILAGCIVFVTIPAVIFREIEEWTALDAIYFVVITLTTVGIGDYVAGTTEYSVCFCFNSYKQNFYQMIKQISSHQVQTVYAPCSSCASSALATPPEHFYSCSWLVSVIYSHYFL